MQWANIFKMLKEKKINQESYIQQTVQEELRHSQINKTFPDKQKLRESVTTRSALRELLKGILQGEMKGH